MTALLGFLRAVIVPLLLELVTKALQGEFAARREKSAVVLEKTDVVTQRPGAVSAAPSKPVSRPVARPPASSWAGWAPRLGLVLGLALPLGGCANRTVETVKTEERVERELRILDFGSAIPGGGALVSDEALVRVAIMEADGSFSGETERRLNGHFVVPRSAWLDALALRQAWDELLATLPRSVPEGSEGPSPYDYARSLRENAGAELRSR